MAAAAAEPRDGVKKGTRAVPSVSSLNPEAVAAAGFLNGSCFRSQNLFYVSPITSDSQYVQKFPLFSCYFITILIRLKINR